MFGMEFFVPHQRCVRDHVGLRLYLERAPLIAIER